MTQPRLLLADDHAKTAEVLHSLLQPEFDVIAKVRDGFALVSAAAGIVIGLAFDSFLGTVLGHWMQGAFAAGSLFAAATLLALSALLACLLPARHAIAVPPAEALRCE